MLKDLLDLIWTRNGDPGAISQAVKSMSEAQIRGAAMIHVAVLLGLEPTAIAGNRIVFAATSAELVPSADATGDIEYRDIRLAFRIKGMAIEQNDGPHTMAGLLDLFQYSRDHSDTLLYLPPNERTVRIADIAKRCGASERFVHSMFSRFGSLQAEIAA